METQNSEPPIEKMSIPKMFGRYCIRRMIKSDWPRLLETIESEKDEKIRRAYNFTQDDADVNFRVALHDWTRGFFVLEDTERAQLLGHVLAIKHTSRHAYVGGFYAHSSINGTEAALKLLEAAFDYSKGKNVLADFRSADLSHALYETEIFARYKPSTGHSSIRFAGHPNWRDLPPLSNQQMYVCHAQMVLPEDVAQFDRTISGHERTEWLRRFLRHSNESWIPRAAQLIVTDRRGEFRAYGCVRPGRDRARIGPIYARDFKAFVLTFRSLMGSSREARERGVDLLVPSSNRQAAEFVESVLNLDRVDEIQRFHSDWHPHVNWDQIYCMSNCMTQFV